MHGIRLDTANTPLIADGADLAIAYARSWTRTERSCPGCNPVTFTVNGGKIISGTAIPRPRSRASPACNVQAQYIHPAQSSSRSAAVFVLEANNKVVAANDIMISTASNPTPWPLAQASEAFVCFSARLKISLLMPRRTYLCRFQNKDRRLKP